MRSVWRFGSMLLWGMMLWQTGQARIIHVPGEYDNFRDASIAAHDGDEIVIAPGVYKDTQLSSMQKNIIIRSTFNGDWSVVRNTIIDAGGDGPPVAFMGEETSKCLIRGFTLRGGTCGIYGGGTHATIEYNIITGNKYNDPYDGVIFKCHGLIQNNIIEGNVSGAGVFYKCHGTIQNNIVRGNQCIGGYLPPPDPHHSPTFIPGSGAAFSACNGTIRNNTVVDNIINDSNFGYHVAPGGLAQCKGLIVNNIIYHTTMTQPLEYDGNSTPTYCLFRAPHAGAGNLAGDPRFVDLARGDFRLRPDSPAIDAGGAASFSRADFDGHPRGMRAAAQAGGDGSGVDLGAYEALPSPVAVWLHGGGPEVIREGQALAVGWALALASGGTAINLRLVRGGQVIKDYGEFYHASGTGVETITLPAPLAAGSDYRIEGRSGWNPALRDATADFAIQGTGKGAADRAWLEGVE